MLQLENCCREHVNKAAILVRVSIYCFDAHPLQSILGVPSLGYFFEQAHVTCYCTVCEGMMVILSACRHTSREMGHFTKLT